MHGFIVAVVLTAIVHTILSMGSLMPLYYVGFALFVACLLFSFIAIFAGIFQSHQRAVREIEMSVTGKSKLPEYIDMQKSTIDAWGLLFLVIVLSPIIVLMVMFYTQLTLIMVLIAMLGIYATAEMIYESREYEQYMAAREAVV